MFTVSKAKFPRTPGSNAKFLVTRTDHPVWPYPHTQTAAVVEVKKTQQRAEPVNITFYFNNGQDAVDRTYLLGDDFQFETPSVVPQGNAFLGWYRSALSTDGPVTPADLDISSAGTSIELYARWQYIQYEVVVDEPNQKMIFKKLQVESSSGMTNIRIDWGDGTIETIAAKSKSNVQHTYATPGTYTLLLPNPLSECTVTGNSSTASTRPTVSFSIILPGYVRNYSHRFDYCKLLSVVLPERYIGGSSSDYYNSTLKTINIQRGLQSIPCFTSCKELKTVTASDSITTFAYYAAFQACSSLTTVMLPDNLESIPSSTFSNCTSMEYIRFGSKLNKILEMAFYKCGIPGIVFDFSKCELLTPTYSKVHQMAFYIDTQSKIWDAVIVVPDTRYGEWVSYAQSIYSQYTIDIRSCIVKASDYYPQQ